MRSSMCNRFGVGWGEGGAQQGLIRGNENRVVTCGQAGPYFYL